RHPSQCSFLDIQDAARSSRCSAARWCEPRPAFAPLRVCRAPGQKPVRTARRGRASESNELNTRRRYKAEPARVRLPPQRLLVRPRGCGPTRIPRRSLTKKASKHGHLLVFGGDGGIRTLDTALDRITV